MTCISRKRLFQFFFLLMLAGHSAMGNTQTCGIGEKIRLFDNGNWKSKNSKTEKLLLELVNDSIFSFDDEKYVQALLLLAEFPDSRSSAVEKLTDYVDRPIGSGSSAASRERQANALFRLVDSKNIALVSITQRARRLLSVELPETVASKAMKLAELGQSDWLRRVEVLSSRNENDLVLSEINQKEPELKMNGSYACRVGFLLGKAFRNVKRYQDARNQLRQVVERCEGDDARDSLFILARLAAISPNPENLKVFDEFQNKHGKHSYVDDVLLFKASALESLGRRAETKRILAEISRLEFPADMKLEAEFRLAYLNALEGNNIEALRVLKSALDVKSEFPAPLAQKQRIKYWYARLQLYPDLLSFSRSPNFERLDAPKKILQELASFTPRTFYSLLSLELLKEMPVPVSTPKIQRVSTRTAAPILDPYFKTCLCMMKGGYLKEAKHLIEIAEPILVNAEQRLAIAQSLNEMGLVADAFRFAQSAGGADGELKDDMDILTLFYPKAHSHEVESASKQIGIPSDLLYGLMREESRFDPRAISWAGARGLFQLMPQVAKEEGIKFKMMNLSDEAILDPEVNILLGAEHLKGMMKRLNHPLFGVAAYNAGFKSANDWQDKFKAFKAIDAFVENIPFPETRGYVKRVASSWANYARVYSNTDNPFKLEIDSSSKKVQ